MWLVVYQAAWLALTMGIEVMSPSDTLGECVVMIAVLMTQFIMLSVSLDRWWRGDA